MNPTNTVYVIQAARLNHRKIGEVSVVSSYDVRYFKSLTRTKCGRRLDRVRSIASAKRFTNLEEAATLCEHLNRNYWLEFSVVENVKSPTK
jgi:hypothetical protein